MTVRILSGALWLYDFPAARGGGDCVRRRPMGCLFSLPVVIQVVHWINTDSGAVPVLRVQQLKTSPTVLLLSGYTRWRGLSTYDINYRPRGKKSKFICRAGEVAVCRTARVHPRSCEYNANGVLHPWITYNVRETILVTDTGEPSAAAGTVQSESTGHTAKHF